MEVGSFVGEDWGGGMERGDVVRVELVGGEVVEKEIEVSE